MIPYRLGIQQRVFPAYRAAFFDALAESCAGGLSVFSGSPMVDEALGGEGQLHRAQHVSTRNIYLGWGPLLMVWQLGMLKWLERWQPDLLIADTNPRNASSNAAIRWMRFHRRPVIGWGLGAPLVRGPLGVLFNPSRVRFLRQFDALIAYSRTGAEQYAATGFPREKIFIAPNAVTSRPAHPLPERPEGFILSDGSPRKPIVLFVGRLQLRKRVDALLRACALLESALQPRLVIVGDGPARAEFEMLSRTVYPTAEFVGDKRGRDLDSLFSSADLFVLPGTGGLAVQQAMSFGLPVIVAEADGTQSELVRPGNGWVLTPGSDQAYVERLAACLAQALADPACLRRMGRESYRIVAEEVNLERMVSVFAQAVQTIFSQKQSSG